MMKKLFITIIIIFFITLLSLKLFHKKNSAIAVNVARASYSELKISVATTEAATIKGFREVAVTAKHFGTVKHIYVKEGDRVAAGQILAQLDREDLRAQVERAYANLLSARAKLKELQQAEETLPEELATQISQAQASLSLAAAKLKHAELQAQAQPKYTHLQVEQAQAAVKAAQAKLSDLQKSPRPEEVKQAEAILNQAKAQMELAKSDYERLQKLFTQGAIAQQQLEAAETRYELSKSDYEKAQAQLKLTQERITPEQIKSVEAELERAQAQLKLSEALKVEELLKKQELSAAKAQLEQAKAALKAVRLQKVQIKLRQQEVAAAAAQVRHAEALLKEAEALQSYTNIYAPISGIVSEVNIKEGEVATGGHAAAAGLTTTTTTVAIPPTAAGGGLELKPAFVIIDTSKLYAEGLIDEADIGKLKLGQSVVLSVDAYPGRQFHGKLEYIAPAAKGRAKERHTFKIKVLITGASTDWRNLLKPGMSCDLEVIVASRNNILLVPTAAVVKRSGKHFVYVVKSNIAKLIRVEVGLYNWEHTEVKKGLVAGDLVITTVDVEGLADGVKIKVKK